jgi:hypothetical protein
VSLTVTVLYVMAFHGKSDALDCLDSLVRMQSSRRITDSRVCTQTQSGCRPGKLKQSSGRRTSDMVQQAG